MRPWALLNVVWAVVSCGVSGQAADPRCTTLCQYKPPAEGDYGNYCNEASARLCAANCSIRIQGESTVCQSCLLEQASFYTGRSSSDSPVCDTSGTCTMSNANGT